MGKFDLIVYCSRAYLECVDLFGESWLKSGAEQVYVHTDAPFEDWREIGKGDIRYVHPFQGAVGPVSRGAQCRRKAECLGIQYTWMKVAAEANYDRGLAMIDADCYVAKPLTPIFENLQHPAITGPNVLKLPGDVSAGAVFLPGLGVNRDFGHTFIKSWLNIQKDIAGEHDSVNVDQQALNRVCRVYYPEVKVLPDEIWNNYSGTNCPKDRQNWLANLRRLAGQVAVVHFAHGQWKYPALVAEAIAACTSSTSPENP